MPKVAEVVEPSGRFKLVEGLSGLRRVKDET